VIGEKIGNYRLVGLIGRGGMGEVYLAEHERIARRAAIKFLLPELSTNAAALERFFAEARAASVIQHPGIVEVLDCGVERGLAFIAMALLDGESLGARLARGSIVTDGWGTLLAIGRQVASAVGAAHDAHIVHRDLKPDNVFLVGAHDDPAPSVRILDFGIAKLGGPDRLGPGVTRTGTVMGTPTYISPEQARGVGAVDHRADIYSLGCILFEMACGRPPFVREGFGELLIAHITERPPAPSSLAPGIPPGLEALVGAMLEKDPGARPASMQEVERALIGLGAGAEPAPRFAAARPPTAQPAPLPPLPPTAILPPPARAPEQTTFGATAAEIGGPRRARGWWGGIAGAGVAGLALSWFLLEGRGARAPTAPPPAERAAAPAPAEAPRAPAPAEAPRAPAPIVLPPRAPAEVTVDVRDPPEGLKVTVDGAPAQLPLRLRSDGARRRIVLRAPGFEPLTREIVADGAQSITVELQRARAVARRPRGGSPRAEPPSTPDPDGLALPRGASAPRGRGAPAVE
jgi:serine/threonine-protein kinase